MDGWLVGWLVGWFWLVFVFWLVGWFVGWLVGLLVGWVGGCIDGWHGRHDDHVLFTLCPSPSRPFHPSPVQTSIERVKLAQEAHVKCRAVGSLSNVGHAAI